MVCMQKGYEIEVCGLHCVSTMQVCLILPSSVGSLEFRQRLLVFFSSLSFLDKARFLSPGIWPLLALVSCHHDKNA